MDSNVVFELTPKRPLEDFLPDLEMEFPDLPADFLLYQLLQSVIRLCQRANVLRRTAVIKTVPCAMNYVLEPPDCMDVIAVMAVDELCGDHVRRVFTADPKPRCNCPLTLDSWFSHGDDFVTIEGNEIIFSARSCNSYKVTMSVQPKEVCDVDSVLYERYKDAVLLGARLALYSMKSRDWAADATTLTMLEKQYRDAVASAALDTLTRKQRGVVKMRHPPVI